MTPRRLLAACAAMSVLALSARAEQRQSRGGGGGTRTPHFRAPAMPTYRGRVLRVPHAAPPRPVQPSRGGPPRQAGPVSRPQPPRSMTPQPSRSVPQQTTRVPVSRGGQTAPAHFSRFGGGFHAPDRDQDGHALNARPILDITHKTDLVHQTIGDPGFARSAQSFAQSSSENDGRYHWHDADGARYSHWHDGARNRDWFGIYQGSSYFWTTLWNGHFWWREPLSGRYLVFWRDHWWWHSPEGVPYVYIDEQFYQWLPNQNGVSLVPLPAAPAEPAAPGGGSEGLIVSSRPEFNYSADGTRMVQVEGEKLSAYLYDADPKVRDTGKPIKFLGDGVTAVAFTDAANGAPLQIVLTVQDAGGAVHTVVLDANGNPLSSAAAAPAAPPVVYGTPGTPGYDAPEADMPPTDAPFPDGQ